MASNEMQIQVAVDPIMHAALCDFAQLIFDAHGVQILGATFDWRDNSAVGERSMAVVAVQLDTRAAM